MGSSVRPTPEDPKPGPDATSPPRRTRYLTIARITSPRGTQGEVRAEILTDFPKRFALLKQVYLGDSFTPYKVQRARLHKGMVLLKLEGCDGTGAAEKLRGQQVQVPVEEAVPLPDGHYYWYQIIGLEVWTTQQRFLGSIKEVLRTGSNDVYVVAGEGRDFLIPAIQEVVKTIDLEHGRMVIEPMEDML